MRQIKIISQILNKRIKNNDLNLNKNYNEYKI